MSYFTYIKLQLLLSSISYLCKSGSCTYIWFMYVIYLVYFPQPTAQLITPSRDTVVSEMMRGSRSPALSRFPRFLALSRRYPCPRSLQADYPGLKEVLYLGFNQNYSAFMCGTESGFKIITCGIESVDEKICRVTSGEGFGIVEILINTNVFALVGGGAKPCHSPKSVIMYNDKEARCFDELAFRSPVRAVKLQPSFVVVVLEFKVFVYNFNAANHLHMFQIFALRHQFETLKMLHEFETLSNIKGLCVTSSTGVIVFPGQLKGQVRVENLRAKSSFEFKAHENSLACLALNMDGSLLATASTRGTLINIFTTNDGTKLQELRRGADQADIFSMAFSADSEFLVLSGSKWTVHIFKIKANEVKEPRYTEEFQNLGSSDSAVFRARSSVLSSVAASAESSFPFVKGVLSKYLSNSDRSFCKFHLPSGSCSSVAFGPKQNTIMIVCTDGSFYECLFDPVKGGPCQLQSLLTFT